MRYSKEFWIKVYHPKLLQSKRISLCASHMREYMYCIGAVEHEHNVTYWAERADLKLDAAIQACEHLAPNYMQL